MHCRTPSRARRCRRPAQFDRVIDALAGTLPAVTAYLEAARADVAFTAFPKQIWRQIWSNNPNERLNQEIRRHADVVAGDIDILIPTAVEIYSAARGRSVTCQERQRRPPIGCVTTPTRLAQEDVLSHPGRRGLESR